MMKFFKKIKIKIKRKRERCKRTWIRQKKYVPNIGDHQCRLSSLPLVISPKTLSHFSCPTMLPFQYYNPDIYFYININLRINRNLCSKKEKQKFATMPTFTIILYFLKDMNNHFLFLLSYTHDNPHSPEF